MSVEVSAATRKLGQKRTCNPKRWTLHARVGPTCAPQYNERNPIMMLTCQHRRRKYLASMLLHLLPGISPSNLALWHKGRPSEQICSSELPEKRMAAAHLFIHSEGLTVLCCTIILCFDALHKRLTLKNPRDFLPLIPVSVTICFNLLFPSPFCFFSSLFLYLR